jgi:hypothetical protein
MGVITFNDKWENLRMISYYNSFNDSFTFRGIANNVYGGDLFSDTAIVNDFVMFSFGQLIGKVNAIKINIDTPLVATSIDGVWEYTSGGTNQVPSWKTLTVTDNTNKFQNSGENEITFDVPEDWENFNYTKRGVNIYYCFQLRFRITSLTGLTEGGKLVNTTDTSQCKPYSIYALSFDDPNNPLTMSQIYAADVAGGWGVVTNIGNQFTFNCNLNYYGGVWYFESKNEQIQFLMNWFWLGDYRNESNFGELISGSKVRFGSRVMFIGNNVNYPSQRYITGENSKIYNTEFRIVQQGTHSAGFNGYWSGGVGSRKGQSLYDVYVEGFRHLDFRNENVIIGVRTNSNGFSGCQIETPGAIMYKCSIDSGFNGVRTNTSNPNDYIHECDLSGAIYPNNPFWATDLAIFHFYHVDCYYGNKTTSEIVAWNHSSSPDTSGDHKVFDVSSFLLQVLDVNKNAISGATVTLKDKNGDTVLDLTTQEDGYATADSGTITSATSNSIDDTTKSWGNVMYREIVVTSGNSIGSRRIIKHGNTATSLPMAWDFEVTPTINDRYIFVPYVGWRYFVPLNYTPRTRSDSTVTDLNPFTLIIRKSGYKTYISIFDLTKKFDEILTLKKTKDIVSEDGTYHIANDENAGLIREDGFNLIEL